MRAPLNFVRNRSGSAAVEMVLVTPLLLALLFGSVEAGNYFLNQHAVSKAVRDGARFGSRMTLANPYSCSEGAVGASGVFEDGNADDKILEVTKTGSVDGSATGRFAAGFWADACPAATAVEATVRCVAKDDYEGIYTALDGDIPVVKVTAAVKYPSVLDSLGFATSALCLRAESEAAVIGI